MLEDRNAQDGHGTHVAGTLTGNDDTNAYNVNNGLAPNALLYFTDLATNASMYVVSEHQRHSGGL